MSTNPTLEMMQQVLEYQQLRRSQCSKSFDHFDTTIGKRSMQANDSNPTKKRKISFHGLSYSQGQTWWKFGTYDRNLTQKLIHVHQHASDANDTAHQFQQSQSAYTPMETPCTQNSDMVPKVQPTLTTPPSKVILSQTTVDRFVSDIDDDDSLSDDNQDSVTDESNDLKFRAYQAENWTEKFEELLEFRSRLGHCLVPNSYEENPSLAQWVKRQRYQYKLKKEGKRSTMSDERVQALEEVGFVWDSHSAAWEERLEELIQYKALHGHCNVPSRYAENRQLAIWVKRQRRQYKFYFEGSPSSMTAKRIEILEALGFQWDMRCKR